MNGIEHSTPLTVMIGEMAELVRGQEHALIERIRPHVRDRSVRLDMSRVERIDAAGITALIKLYCAAHEAGHRFTIVHSVPRVKEILSLVGVIHLLTTETEDSDADGSLPLELTAA